MGIRSAFILLLLLSLNLTAGFTAAHFARQDTLSEQQDRFFQGALVVWATSAAALADLLIRYPTKDDGRE